MNIVGLGQAGCNIADTFKQYPQYTVYKIDKGITGERCLSVPAQQGPEEYEESAQDYSNFFSDISGEVLFVVSGSGDISGMSLALLEQLKDRTVSVLYVQPSTKNLTGRKKMLERATFGILQQYARSGLIEEIFLVNSEAVAKSAGNLPVIGYFDKINQMIVSCMHFINVFERTEHIYGVVQGKDNVCRISTIGMLDTDTSEEKMFFDLDLIREKSYFYAMREERLLNETNMIQALEEKLEEKKTEWLTNFSYRLYSTEYETDFGFCIHRTSKVQGE